MLLIFDAFWMENDSFIVCMIFFFHNWKWFQVSLKDTYEYLCIETLFWFTYFSSGGGGISCVDGHLGGVFSHSIIASGASGKGIGLTEFVSIVHGDSLVFAVLKLLFYFISLCLFFLLGDFIFQLIVSFFYTIFRFWRFRFFANVKSFNHSSIITVSIWYKIHIIIYAWVTVWNERQTYY